MSEAKYIGIFCGLMVISPALVVAVYYTALAIRDVAQVFTGGYDWMAIMLGISGMVFLVVILILSAIIPAAVVIIIGLFIGFILAMIVISIKEKITGESIEEIQTEVIK